MQDFRGEPSSMKAFDQARYIMESLLKGETVEKIAAKFNEDKQLVQMWILFLQYNHFITIDDMGRIAETSKGEVLRNRNDKI